MKKNRGKFLSPLVTEEGRRVVEKTFKGKMNVFNYMTTDFFVPVDN